MTQKPLKQYKITKKGVEIHIQTDSTKNDTIMTMFRALFREVSSRHPEELDEMMKRLNAGYKAIKRERALKAARKAGKPLKDDPELIEPLDDFEFWERIMQRRY